MLAVFSTQPCHPHPKEEDIVVSGTILVAKGKVMCLSTVRNILSLLKFNYGLLTKNVTDNHVQATPSSHRQPLASSHFPPTSIGRNNIQSHMAGTPLPLPHGRATPRRTPLSSINVNTGQPSSFVGYGLRAGLKVGNPGASLASDFARPSGRLGISVLNTFCGLC